MRKLEEEIERLATIARVGSYSHGEQLFTNVEAASISLMWATCRYSDEESNLVEELKELKEKLDDKARQVEMVHAKKIACYQGAIALLPVGQTIDNMYALAEEKRKTF